MIKKGCFKELVKTVQNLKGFNPDIKQKRVQELNKELLANIKKNLRKLRKLLKEVNRDYGDNIYRFYHGSFKVYYVQDMTVRIVETLKSLAPEGITEFNSMFEKIFKEGTGKE